MTFTFNIKRNCVKSTHKMQYLTLLCRFYANKLLFSQLNSTALLNLNLVGFFVEHE